MDAAAFYGPFLRTVSMPRIEGFKGPSARGLLADHCHSLPQEDPFLGALADFYLLHLGHGVFHEAVVGTITRTFCFVEAEFGAGERTADISSCDADHTNHSY